MQPSSFSPLVERVLDDGSPRRVARAPLRRRLVLERPDAPPRAASELSIEASEITMKPTDIAPSNPSPSIASPSVRCSSGRSARAALGSAALLALVATGCGGGGGGAGNQGSGNEVGVVLDHPDAGPGTSQTLTVDANQGGNAQSVKLTRMFYGRLVDVRDVTGELRQKDMVIGENVEDGDPDFEFSTNPVTEETSVTIQYPFSADPTSPYQNAFRRLDQNVTPLQDKSLDPDELPPFSLVPRNSALVLQFNDLLDPTKINADNIRVFTGNPPEAPFELRVIADPNYGDVLGEGAGAQFYPTRVILDTTVSTLESVASNPPLQTNPVGLPPSQSLDLANLAIRIPTKKAPDFNQIEILRNVSGNPVAFNNNGSNDPGSPTLDVVRAARTGGNTGVTNDPNNGFLEDEIPPRIVGTQPIAVSTPIGGPDEFLTTLTYSVGGCAGALKQGDVIEQAGVFAEVLEATAPPTGSQIAEVNFRIVFPPEGQLTAGLAQVTTVFDPILDIGREPCFVRFTQINTPPNQGVLTTSQVLVRFSEPMDPISVGPFDTVTVTRTSTPGSATDYVVGKMEPEEGQKVFRYTPSLPYQHTLGSANDDYFVTIFGVNAGPTDLAGNHLPAGLPPVQFKIAATEPTRNTAGFALRFTSLDELDPFNFNELRGQFLINFEQQFLRPRTVTRYPAIADRSQAIPGLMPVFTPGIQTPLSSLGSKMQTLWRYCDVGFGLLDEANINVDIEGLAWAPVGGAAVADSFERFEIILSHSNKLPDETIDPLSLLPIYPQSGLIGNYSANLLSAQLDPQKIVHPRERGYTVNPADLFPATSGTLMMPFPLNRGIPASQFRYYTWRDTSIQAKGGLPDSPGAELAVVCNVLFGGPSPTPGVGCNIGRPYPINQVPTVGLPILMEFKTFPDDGALGLNSFDVSFAVNSSARPNFRAFSTGGVNSSGQVIEVDPDLEQTASGGFNPNSTPPGASTPAADNTFYMGQLDLVLRISRAHSIWFNSGFPVNQVTYGPPVLEPRPEQQPDGTAIELAFRGAANVTATPATNDRDASKFDFYGEPIVTGTTPAFTVAYFGDNTWKSTISAINGAPRFQTRITFLSNPQTNLSPTLSSLAFAYSSP